MVNCFNCRKHIDRFQSQIRGKKSFCSFKCKGIFQSSQKGKIANRSKCLICKKMYFAKPSHLKMGRKCCSMKCRSKLMMTWRGEKSLRWKGGWKHEKGYIVEGNIMQHRRIMEDHLGRKIKPWPKEIVHHKNGKKDDNRIENLEVMTLSDHSRMHHLKK